MTIAFLFILLFGLMALGAPIAISLGVSSLATILMFGDDSLATLAEKLFGGMADKNGVLKITPKSMKEILKRAKKQTDGAS